MGKSLALEKPDVVQIELDDDKKVKFCYRRFLSCYLTYHYFFKSDKTTVTPHRRSTRLAKRKQNVSHNLDKVQPTCSNLVKKSVSYGPVKTAIFKLIDIS